MFPAVTGEDRSASETEESADQGPLATVPARRSVDWSDSVDSQQSEEDIMQISGKGHWFLEGWIGDHAVDFLVDSGSAVTAVSRSFFDRLSEAGAPTTTYREEITWGKWVTNRDFRLLLLCGVVFGSEGGVPYTGVRLKHRRYHWNRHTGICIASHPGHKERIAIHRGRSVTSTT